MENLLFILSYLMIFIWLFIPIRQYKQNLFLVFLILVLNDVLAVIAMYTILNNNYIIYHIGTFLAILFVPRLPSIAKNKILFFAMLITIVIFNIYNTEWQYDALLQTFLYTVLFFAIFHYFFVDIFDKGVNFFGIILLFFLILQIYKFVILLFDTNPGIYYYDVSNAFEILIGVFFLIFKEDNKKLIIRVTKNRSSDTVL